MKKVYNYLDTLLNYNDTVIVACSSGPDSMCLLNILLEYRNRKKINVICAHVNHNVRAQSKLEEEYIREFCKNNNVELEYMKIESYNNINFHADARNIRYQFLDKLVQKYKANYVMTAHHGDDLIETILMKIIRGSNLDGIAGIRLETNKNNYKLVRPLIYVTKEDCIEYNNQNNIKYFIDESNKEDDYLRNRIRHHILPQLKKENEQIHTKFLEFSEELLITNEFINNHVKTIIPTIINNNKLDIDKFKTIDKIIQIRIIQYMLKDNYDNTDKLNKKHLNAIIELIYDNKPNLSIDLPDNKIAVKEYNIFEIKEHNSNKDYIIEFKDSITINNFGTIRIVDNSEITNNYYCYLNSKDIKLPIFVRNRREGDKVAIKNMNGHQKLKDLFINAKLPQAKRDEYPLVVDSNDNILWVPGIKKTKFDSNSNTQYDIILKYEEEKNEN
ncbi:MAG: tRNA lysidine(34) synthetase TilS [Bacilli bacterium]|nr:tRNA lysidine(34) synthetase TilS [Bacilli bacterium]